MHFRRLADCAVDMVCCVLQLCSYGQTPCGATGYNIDGAQVQGTPDNTCCSGQTCKPFLGADSDARSTYYTKCA